MDDEKLEKKITDLIESDKKTVAYALITIGNGGVHVVSCVRRGDDQIEQVLDECTNALVDDFCAKMQEKGLAYKPNKTH